MQQIPDILYSAKKYKPILQKRESLSIRLPVPLRGLRRHEINALYFLSLENLGELCRFFEITIDDLWKVINYPGYTCHVIKKKGGGVRHISAPENGLKKRQKRLNYFLQAYYLWIKPAEVHGFVSNPDYLTESRCHIVSNAKAHTGKKHVLNIDLKDFFSSISALRIKKLFMSSVFNCSERMATALALLTTYEGKLPTGAPSSPVLSNFVCLQLDSDLKSFCQENYLDYTRYADDLTFSSNYRIPEETISEIKALISRNGFETNEKKVHLRSSYGKQTVTGLVVNEKVNVDRKFLKRIRAMLHDLMKNGIEAATQRHFSQIKPSDEKQQKLFINRLSGYINFVGQVRGSDDAMYRKMQNELYKIVKNEENSQVSGHGNREEVISQALGDHYYVHVCDGKVYYIVLKHDYYVLYSDDLREIIDSKFAADKIIPFKDISRQNELIVIRNNQKGIYYIDRDFIRWGYKGAIDENGH